MDIEKGDGPTIYGEGIEITLSGDEVAIAIEAYLLTHGVRINGPRTVTVNKILCECGGVYVDPSGEVIINGRGISAEARERE